MSMEQKIDDLDKKVKALIEALRTSHGIIEFKEETIVRLEMEIARLRKENDELRREVEAK